MSDSIRESKIVISRALRACMEEANLSNEQVGEKLDVTPRTVMGWRRATFAPYPDRCEQIAEVFGLSVWDFYDRGR